MITLTCARVCLWRGRGSRLLSLFLRWGLLFWASVGGGGGSDAMSIHFISGKPRGGKTLYAFQLLVEELVYGKRLVVTNIAVKLGELNAYLQKHYPDADIDLHERLRILTDDEVLTFFAYRTATGGPLFEVPDDKQWKAGAKLDLSCVTGPGVLYLIDEVHLYFDARRWMEVGRSCGLYFSQHAKLGDDIVGITQVVGDVEKRFRNRAQDFTYMRNLSKEKLGFFRAPDAFVRSTYSKPEGGTNKPMDTKPFRLNLDLANCYDTSAGVGILGRLDADKGRKAKGLPFWMMPVCVMLLGAGCFVLAIGMGRGVGWFLTGGARVKKSGGLIGMANGAAASFATNNPMAAKFGAMALPGGIAYVARSNDVVRVVLATNAPIVAVKGRWLLEDGWHAQLTDGRVVGPSEGFHLGLKRESLLDGKPLPWWDEVPELYQPQRRDSVPVNEWWRSSAGLPQVVPGPARVARYVSSS